MILCDSAPRILWQVCYSIYKNAQSALNGDWSRESDRALLEAWVAATWLNSKRAESLESLESQLYLLAMKWSKERQCEQNDKPFRFYWRGWYCRLKCKSQLYWTKTSTQYLMVRLFRSCLCYVTSNSIAFIEGHYFDWKERHIELGYMRVFRTVLISFVTTVVRKRQILAENRFEARRTEDVAEEEFRREVLLYQFFWPLCKRNDRRDQGNYLLLSCCLSCRAKTCWSA